MKKSIVVLPLIALAMILPSSEAVAGYITGSMVYVIYDADEGKFSDGLNMKSFAVRKGIAWDQLNAREKPSEDPTPSEDQMVFDSWYFNGEPISEPSRFIVNNDIRVTANYKADESTHNFQEDSWSVLARVIAEGGDDPIKALHDNYGVSEGGTLVGRERTINFNGSNYTVRVIGEGQDYQTYDETKSTKEEQYTNPVALTFEFVNTFDVVPFAFGDITDNYENSYLSNYLNTDVFNLFDKSARRYMKPVYKCTNIGEGSSTLSSAGKCKPVLNTIFPISLMELNADKYNEKAKAAIIEYDFPYDIEQEAGRDDTPYTYYKNADVSLAKTNLNGEATPYWTRSPEVESKWFVWHIAKDGGIGDPDYAEAQSYNEQVPMEVTRSIAVCPCFCY